MGFYVFLCFVWGRGVDSFFYANEERVAPAVVRHFCPYTLKSMASEKGV
jgi:hypothetical protein